MTTPLKSPLKREIVVGQALYTIVLTEEGLTLVPKGRRKGLSLQWANLVSGDAALAHALNASLTAAPPPRQNVRTEKNDR